MQMLRCFRAFQDARRPVTIGYGARSTPQLLLCCASDGRVLMKQQPWSHSGDQDVDTALSVYERLCPYWDKKARPGYCQRIQFLLCPVFSSEDTGAEYELVVCPCVLTREDRA